MSKILCVDDEPHVVKLKCAILEAAGHSVTPATSSGYVAEAFQAAEPLADLYLEKPVNPEELVTIVNELLKTSERA
jgi:CheY-like chemotaxis protein